MCFDPFLTLSILITVLRIETFAKRRVTFLATLWTANLTRTIIETFSEIKLAIKKTRRLVQTKLYTLGTLR